MDDFRDDASHASSSPFNSMNLYSPGSRDRRIEDERFVEDRVGVELRLQFDEPIEAEMSDHHDDESVNSTLTLDVNLLSPGSHVSSQQEQEQDSRLPYQQPCATYNGAHSEQVQVHRRQPCATYNGVHSEQKNDCIADSPVPPIMECTRNKNDRSNNDSPVPPIIISSGKKKQLQCKPHHDRRRRRHHHHHHHRLQA